MNLLRILLPTALSLLVCRPLAAQTGTAICPNKSYLMGLKEAIDSARRYPSGIEGYRFADYRIVHEAACAGKGVDKNRARQRIALMWQQQRNAPASPDSTLRLRDVVRYAIRQRYQPLMLAAAQSWGLDLNEMDETGQTLLQFLDEEIEREPDSSQVRMLKEYRDIYAAAGAQHPQHLSFMIKILSERYDAVRRYAYGLYAVEKKGKWGWVNQKGEVVISLQYKAVRYYLPDLFEVSTDGVHYYFVDRKNKPTRGPWD